MARTPLYHNFALQTAATTGNGTAVDLLGVSTEVTIYIKWASAVSTGTIQVETSDSTTYTGTWAPLGAAVAFSGTAPKTDVVTLTGCYKAVRARFTVNTDVASDVVLFAT